MLYLKQSNSKNAPTTNTVSQTTQGRKEIAYQHETCTIITESFTKTPTCTKNELITIYTTNL